MRFSEADEATTHREDCPLLRRVGRYAAECGRAEQDPLRLRSGRFRSQTGNPGELVCRHLPVAKSQCDFTWKICARKAFDGIALKVETHRSVWRVVDDESCRRTEERNDRRVMDEAKRLCGECHGSLCKVERDF